MSNFGKLVSGRIRQICFIVPDPLASAKKHSELYGSGPFFVQEHYLSTSHLYRGKEGGQLDVSSACGNLGDVMIEFTTQHNDTPSAYRDVFPNRGTGLHHYTFFTDDAKADRAKFAAAGFELATYYEIDSSGYGYSFFDTRSALGVMTEVYEECYVGPFYKFCEEATRNWDGKDPLRGIEEAAAVLGKINESLQPTN